ncbi:MAG TPA: hypothetical protein VMB25_01270 [Bryobacteraceae bacterium]|nr:hypothetical protein [Bryobacteraceae bacterium]
MLLALNSPVIQQGSYFSHNGAAHGEFLALRSIDGGAVIGPDALSRTLLDIDQLGKVGLGNEAPTLTALGTAKRLLSEAQVEKPIYAMPSVIEGSEGDLLIHWDTAVKNVVLICPASPGKPPQIYREVLKGRKAVSSQISDASPKALSDALTWVLQAK